MKLSRLSIKELRIPFKQAFQHSSHSRNTTETVLVTANTTLGFVGLGEGCPRSYVTGETLDSCRLFFETWLDDFMAITSIFELRQWQENNNVIIDQNPAAFCAVELSLLNALSMEQGVSIEKLLSISEIQGVFQYSAILGSKNPETFKALMQRHLDLGITDFKVKIFGDERVDNANFDHIRNANSVISRLRLDANNLWESSDQAMAYIENLNCNLFAIEEPLALGKIDNCVALAKALDLKIILDESFLNDSHFEPILNNLDVWIINIRVSKMGGVLRSLRIAEQAMHLGIPVLVGAQVGETSLLTRAAISIASFSASILVAQEGGYGTFLLEQDIVNPSLMFGKQGIIHANQVPNFFEQ